MPLARNAIRPPALPSHGTRREHAAAGDRHVGVVRYPDHLGAGAVAVRQRASQRQRVARDRLDVRELPAGPSRASDGSAPRRRPCSRSGCQPSATTRRPLRWPWSGSCSESTGCSTVSGPFVPFPPFTASGPTVGVTVGVRVGVGVGSGLVRICSGPAVTDGSDVPRRRTRRTPKSVRRTPGEVDPAQSTVSRFTLKASAPIRIGAEAGFR